MTPSQRKYYIDLWFRVCDANNWNRNDADLRHAEVAAALDGNAKSFRDFSNRDFDRVIAHFKALIESDEFDPSQLDGDPAEQGEKKRLIFRIKQLGAQLPQGYAAAILRDRFRIIFEEELHTCPISELTQIRNTLWARLQSSISNQKQPTQGTYTS